MLKILVCDRCEFVTGLFCPWRGLCKVINESLDSNNLLHFHYFGWWLWYNLYNSNEILSWGQWIRESAIGLEKSKLCQIICQPQPKTQSLKIWLESDNDFEVSW